MFRRPHAVATAVIAAACCLCSGELPPPDVEIWSETADQDFLLYAGKPLDVRLRPDRDAYVVVIGLDASGRARLLFPHSQRPHNVVQAGEIIDLGAVYQVEGIGPLFVKAIVGTSPLLALSNGRVPLWWPVEWGTPPYAEADPGFACTPPAPRLLQAQRTVTRDMLRQWSAALSAQVDDDFERFDRIALRFVHRLGALLNAMHPSSWNEEELLLYTAPEMYDPDLMRVVDDPLPVRSHVTYRSGYHHRRYTEPLFHDPLRLFGTWVAWHGVDVWVPIVRVVGWRPYLRGHWEAGPCGWQWIPDMTEPWGAITYRHGYWTHLPGHGWAWVPRRAPAHVHWYEADGYIGWSPAPLPVTVRAALGFHASLDERCPLPVRTVFVPARHFAVRTVHGVPHYALYYAWQSTDIERRGLANPRTVRRMTAQESRPRAIEARHGLRITARETHTRPFAFSAARREHTPRMDILRGPTRAPAAGARPQSSGDTVPGRVATAAEAPRGTYSRAAPRTEPALQQERSTRPTPRVVQAPGPQPAYRRATPAADRERVIAVDRDTPAERGGNSLSASRTISRRSVVRSPAPAAPAASDAALPGSREPRGAPASIEPPNPRQTLRPATAQPGAVPERTAAPAGRQSVQPTAPAPRVVSAPRTVPSPRTVSSPPPAAAPGSVRAPARPEPAPRPVAADPPRTAGAGVRSVSRGESGQASARPQAAQTLRVDPSPSRGATPQPSVRTHSTSSEQNTRSSSATRSAQNRTPRRS